MKRALSTMLALALLLSMIPALPAAAETEDAPYPLCRGLMELSVRKPAYVQLLPPDTVPENYNPYDKLILYMDPEFTTQGTVSRGATSHGWMKSTGEVRVCGAGVNANGEPYATLYFGLGEINDTAYVPLKYITAGGEYNGDSKVCRKKIYTRETMDSPIPNNRYIGWGDLTYLLYRGETWCQVMYPISQGWRIAWCLTADYERYIKWDRTFDGTDLRVKALLDVALSQVGYHEKYGLYDLDSFYGDPGANNYTKYGKYLDDLWEQGYHLYNDGHKNGFGWCEIFVDWCFMYTFGFERTLELTGQVKDGNGTSARHSYYYYKNRGEDPRLGAQIFFYRDGTIGHSGLVYDFDSTSVYVVEGNSDNAVSLKQYDRWDPSIVGYGYPDYK